MPQASVRQHALMEKWFGDPVGEEGPIRFLESRGYELLRDWHWRKPTPSHTVSVEEAECIAFLVAEWDFGWTLS